MWSLKNMSVAFRVKGQYQAASHSPVYSGVAEVAAQPVAGVRGGVTARCRPLSLWPRFAKSAQINLFVKKNCHMVYQEYSSADRTTFELVDRLARVHE